MGAGFGGIVLGLAQKFTALHRLGGFANRRAAFFPLRFAHGVTREHAFHDIRQGQESAHQRRFKGGRLCLSVNHLFHLQVIGCHGREGNR